MALLEKKRPLSTKAATDWRSIAPGNRSIELRPESLKVVRGATRTVRSSFDFEAGGDEPLFTYTTLSGEVFHEMVLPNGGLRIGLFRDDNGQPGELIAESAQ